METFKLVSLRLDKSIQNWKEPFRVGKLKVNVEIKAWVEKKKLKFETMELVGKLGAKLERSNNSMICRV